MKSCTSVPLTNPKQLHFRRLLPYGILSVPNSSVAEEQYAIGMCCPRPGLWAFYGQLIVHWGIHNAGLIMDHCCRLKGTGSENTLRRPRSFSFPFLSTITCRTSLWWLLTLLAFPILSKVDALWIFVFTLTINSTCWSWWSETFRSAFLNWCSSDVQTFDSQNL